MTGDESGWDETDETRISRDQAFFRVYVSAEHLIANLHILHHHPRHNTWSLAITARLAGSYPSLPRNVAAARAGQVPRWMRKHETHALCAPYRLQLHARL
jgi:hypothetical protein